VRKDDVDAVNTEGVTLGALEAWANLPCLRGGLRFALAFLEGIEIVEQVVAYFFQIVGDAPPGYFSLSSSITPSTRTEAASCSR